MTRNIHHVVAVCGEVIDGKVVWTIDPEIDLPGSIFDNNVSEWRGVTDDDLTDEALALADLRKRLSDEA